MLERHRNVASGASMRETCLKIKLIRDVPNDTLVILTLTSLKRRKDVATDT